MEIMIYLGLLFAAKMLDNALSTAKTILIQRNRCLLAGLSMIVSSFIYYWLTKAVVYAGSDAAIIVVSIASGVGGCLAIWLNNRISKDRIYVNVVMSDDKEAVMAFRDFLAQRHITNVVTDSYTLDWNTKTMTVTAYAETKEQSRQINGYLKNCNQKFKRVVQKI